MDKSDEKQEKKSGFRLRLPKFKSVVALANSKLSIKYSAIILAASTLVSALLGLLRDRLLNSYYLDTYPTGIDAYTAAFTIPDLLFSLITSGALAVSFIPVFNQRLVTGNKKSAWELSSSMINFMAILTFVASVLIMIFADPLVRYVVSPGLDESGTALAISMMRVIAINPFLFSISAVLSSMQQAVSRFVFYALAPAVYNVGILIGITVFTNGVNLFGFGALLQLAVNIVGLAGLGFDYEFKIKWKNQGFKTVLSLLPARSLDQCVDYVDNIVSTNLSSRMGAGTLRSFQQAMTLHQMPVNLIGVAISTAFFPKLTEEIGGGEEEAFRKTFRQALRSIIWIALPVAIIAFFARGYVVSFIKNGGDATIASILAALIISVFARSVYHIATRGFYANQDTKTPLKVSCVSVGLIIMLSIAFYKLGLGAEGLGYAQSIGAMTEIVLLLSILQVRMKGRLLNKQFWHNVFKMLIATVITGAVAYSMTKFFPLMATDDSVFSTLPKFALITAVSAVAYLIAGYFLNLDEVKTFVGSIKKRLPKRKKKKV